jgi:hypothetical protein
LIDCSVILTENNLATAYWKKMWSSKRTHTTKEKDASSVVKINSDLLESLMCFAWMMDVFSWKRLGYAT